MTSTPVDSQIEVEIGRVRELSKLGRHSEALTAAEALLSRAAQERDVLYLIAANQRCLHLIWEALETLQRLEQHKPKFSLLYQERGFCYMALRDALRSIDAFRRAVSLNPALLPSWSMLERLYRMTGQEKNAVAAADQLAALNQVPPEVVRAGSLFSDGDLSRAEKILREYLRNATHTEALRLLGRIQHQRNLLDDAEQLLEAARKAAPNYRAAQLDFIHVLLAGQKYQQAREEIEANLESGDKDYLLLYAAASAGLGQHKTAIAAYRQLITGSPQSPELHLALGHSLRSDGKQKDSIESYQRAAAIRPSFGDAWWSLANLRTYRFSDDEIAHMREEEAAPAAHWVDHYHLCFALGKAYEDQDNYPESWKFYERGNTLKRAEIRYDPEISEADARKHIDVFAPQFFADRSGIGAHDRGPIFIVGLPRSGSTLIEQILASHSQVEGTHELYEIERMVLGLRARSAAGSACYPGSLAELARDDFRALGERYMRETRAYRRARPFFIDKMPNNFRHIGLIHLMLPNSTIVDVRREPMACCCSNLKQLFASGQEFTYSFEDIARHYRTYLELMRHWDAVLPGRVLRVRYEEVVDDLDRNVRRMLEFCGLGFEPACLEFHRTVRSVNTASSEQVRQPIFSEGLYHWRNYEPWLGPLREALGDALIRYRDQGLA
jgi:tetratricopeptide (TPR) repeat protein